VFKVKYDGREISCDYTEPVFFSDMSNVNKNITVDAKFISPPTYLAFADWFLMKTNSVLCKIRTEDYHTKEDYFLSSKVYCTIQIL